MKPVPDKIAASCKRIVTRTMSCASLILIAGIALTMYFQAGLQHRAQSTQPQDWDMLRDKMVSEQIQKRGVQDAEVLDALKQVERHRFIPNANREHAYEDRALGIGKNQTISQPYIVGLMSELLQSKGGDKVLEIGTGSGYQAAVLASMGREVYTIEIVEELARHAQTTLQELGYENIHTRLGDGYLGWPEAAPFDGIIVTAAPGEIPQPLIDQLKVGGRMVIPVGDHPDDQKLQVLVKTETGTEIIDNISVRFVPMTGLAE